MARQVVAARMDGPVVERLDELAPDLEVKRRHGSEGGRAVAVRAAVEAGLVVLERRRGRRSAAAGGRAE